MPAKLTLDRFIERSRLAHGDRYDYSQAQYINNLLPIVIICPSHGPFMQRAAHHMDGHGCPRCKADLTIARCTDTLDSFIVKARTVHGETYDYSSVSYTRSNQRVEIICPTHGPFWQTPNSHVSSKSGCPKCAGKFLSTADFVAKSQAVHGGRYDYQKTAYRLTKDKVTITCPVHGDFEQIAEAHMLGRGCRFCWYEATTSRGEDDVAAWVAELGCEVMRNRRDLLNHTLELDIYVPEQRIGIEFNGCYWHSDRHNKNTRILESKYQLASKAGIRLITVWDFDWRHRQDVVKQHLRHALGRDTGPTYGARRCSLVTLSTIEANRLYADHHLQGAMRGGVLHLGLQFQGETVASMSFTQGATRRGKHQDGEWELARYATAARVPGGAGRLFAAFVATKRPAVVWSFSDHQHFAGGLYPRLGFVHDGNIPADYRVVHPATLRTWHKSLWQRKSIPARLRELRSKETFDPNTDPRTEQQMQNLVNVLRVWDAGKARWAWRPH